jgi:hypothetical protein
MCLDAVESNESRFAWHSNCEYFQLRPRHHKMLEAFEQRVHTITFGIDADMVAESNRMWRGRFAIAAFVLVCIIEIGYLFWSLL